MSISNNRAEDNSVPYTSFFDIEKSFSPAFFGNKKSSKRTNSNYNGRLSEQKKGAPLSEKKVTGSPLFCDEFNYEACLFL